LDQRSPAIRDAKRQRVSFDDGMSTGRRAQLRLVIDAAAEPITGTLETLSGQAIEFSGWLGFAAAIEQALGRDGGAAPVSQPTGLSSSPAVVPRAEDSSSREWMPSFE
jgi:hypothetical protein